MLPGARRLRADGTPAPPSARLGGSCLALRQVECRVCAEHCELGAIRFSLRPGGVPAPLIDAGRCNGCGDCLAVCPTAALKLI